MRCADPPYEDRLEKVRNVLQRKPPGAPHEAHFLRLDSSKAAVELGWRAMLTPEERVGWTVEWYKANAAWVASISNKEYLSYYAKQYGNT